MNKENKIVSGVLSYILKISILTNFIVLVSVSRSDRFHRALLVSLDLGRHII